MKPPWLKKMCYSRLDCLSSRVNNLSLRALPCKKQVTTPACFPLASLFHAPSFSTPRPLPCLPLTPPPPPHTWKLCALLIPSLPCTPACNPTPPPSCPPLPTDNHLVTLVTLAVLLLTTPCTETPSQRLFSPPPRFVMPNPKLPSSPSLLRLVMVVTLSACLFRPSCPLLSSPLCLPCKALQPQPCTLPCHICHSLPQRYCKTCPDMH